MTQAQFEILSVSCTKYTIFTGRNCYARINVKFSAGSPRFDYFCSFGKTVKEAYKKAEHDLRWDRYYRRQNHDAC